MKLLIISGLLLNCHAVFSQTAVKLTAVASGFTSPVGMAAPNDGSKRLFVFEQGGKVYVIKNGVVSKTPFIDLSSRLDGLNIAYSEKGLLGMAFHPQYKSNGKFYVYYSAPAKGKNIDHKSVISCFRVSSSNSDIADTREQVIMEIIQPESNHNGGNLAFGPDGYLYIGTGDGGGANDEHGTIGNGQNTQTLLGKILRIDVNKSETYTVPEDNPFYGKTGFKSEIWAYGLRNPWRFSFDKVTGRLFCGDVGQNTYEEINIIKKGGNYGWRIMEGYHCFNPATNCDKTGLELPVDEYDHETGISICGGYMYRGKKYPSLHGTYFFGDWSGKVFSLKQQQSGTWERQKVFLNGTKSNETEGKINSFGEDAEGEIYILTQKLFGPRSPTGVLYRIDL